MEMNRILIADDHPLVRSGIVALLSSAMPGCRRAEAASLSSRLLLMSMTPGARLASARRDGP
jgi:DNA-binding NarL/FixJ family response regulator